MSGTLLVLNKHVLSQKNICNEVMMTHSERPYSKVVTEIASHWDWLKIEWKYLNYFGSLYVGVLIYR